ncbi:MAG: GNAT family N-acetyltransferase [Bacteroidota bacterium]
MQELYHTERLELQRLRHRHAQELFDSYTSRPQVAYYMRWKAHQELEETHAFIAREVLKWEGETDYSFAMVLRSTGRSIGCISVMTEMCKAEVGYVLGDEYWNQGLTTEAFQRLIPEIFQLPKVVRIEAICDVENRGSSRVMEHVGMQREAVLRKYFLGANLPDPRDVYLYSLFAEA